MSQVASPTFAAAPDASDVVAEIALAINQAPGDQEVPGLVVEKSVEALRGTSGSVMLPCDEPGRMRLVAAAGLPADTPLAPETPVADWVVRHDEPMLLLGRGGPLARLLKREHIRDAVCVPLRYAGTVIGALSVSNSENRPPFGPEDVQLLTVIGHLAAVALRNTMLLEEACERKALLQDLLRQLWSAQEDERKRLADDLHDGPAQGLYHIVFRLQAARSQEDVRLAADNIAHAEQSARETLSQVRSMMAGLRPMALDDLGLVSALRAECDAVAGRGRIRVESKVSGEPRRFDSDLETALYRMAREALSNVERHADCEAAGLEVVFGDDGVTVSVSDKGRGFTRDTALAARAAGRYGLSALRERAEALGISVNVGSKVGHGTRIRMSCPWRTDT